MIGSGFGGLAAAIRLQAAGFQTVIFEKRDQPGGRAYVYRAAETARSLAARAVRQIIDRLCKGSVEELVSGMVDAKVLSKSELESLQEFVRNYKKGGR